MAYQGQITGAALGASRYPKYESAVLGFTDYWYPVMSSRELRSGHPLALTLFDRQIVFARSKGRVYALHDRCPHRGIPLSIGKQLFPRTLSCRYHGWTFDLESGKLVAVLTDGPESPICGKITVQAFHVAERAGLIWIYNGEGEPPPVEANIPKELLADTATSEARITTRAGDWRHAAENGFDEGHGKFLHRDSIFVTFAHPPAYVTSDVIPEEDGWITREPKSFAFQADYPGLGVWPPKRFWKSTKLLSRASIRLPGTLRIAFENWMHFEWYVPTTPGNHRYVQVVVKQARGLRGLLFRAYYWTVLRWLFHVEFNNQDARVVELMKTPPERLYRPDTSIIGWRKLCETDGTLGTASPTIDRQRPEDQFELRDNEGMTV